MYTLLSQTFEEKKTLYSTIETDLEYDLTKNISNLPRTSTNVKIRASTP